MLLVATLRNTKNDQIYLPMVVVNSGRESSFFLFRAVHVNLRCTVVGTMKSRKIRKDSCSKSK